MSLSFSRVGISFKIFGDVKVEGYVRSTYHDLLLYASAMNTV